MKHHGRPVGGVDFVDHYEIALSGADDAVWRKNDLVPTRGDIFRCQWRAVGEFDSLTDLEGVGLSVVCRLWHALPQITDEIVGLARIVGVCTDQNAVERCGRVDRRVGLLSVRV